MGTFKKRFSDLTIRTKLVTLIVLFLLSHVLISGVAGFLFRSLETLNIVVNQQRVFIENFHKGVEHFYEFELNADPEDLQGARVHFDKAYQIAYTFSHLESLMDEMPKEEWAPLFYNVFDEGVESIDQIELMASQIHMLSRLSDETLLDIKATSTDAYLLADRLISLIDGYNEEQSAEYLELMGEALAEIDPITASFTSRMYELNDKVTQTLIGVMSVIIIILIAFATFIAVLISKSIGRPIRKLAANFKKIANGNLKTSVQIESENEIGDLSKAFSEIQVGLQEVISLSKKVAKGDYDVRFRQKSDEDELAPALNKMASKLEEARVNTEKENWVQTGITGLEDQMRGNFSVRELSDRIIVYISRFLEIEMGAVYVFDEVLEQLELTGSVGLDTSQVNHKIKPDGGGLIAKAAKHSSLQEINTKDKYHKIYSATGEIVPEKIYLLPMQYNGRIQAVIELAPVNEMSKLKLRFLEAIKEQISINLNASVARFRSKELLDQTTEQAKVLKEREEELSKRLEENERIQKELILETALLDSMLKTLPDYVYFKDIESKFIRASESMVDLFNAKSADELIGKSDYDFHPRDKAKMYYDEEQKIIREREGFIDEIRKGEDKNGEEMWSSTTKLPMFDSTGKCIGTFGITKDITNIKKLEIEVNKRNDELNAQKEELKVINDQLKQQQEELKATNEELKSQEEELRVANEELAEQTKVLTENEKNLQIQQEELRVTNEELETKTSQLEQQKKEITEKNENLLKTQNELRQKAKELEQASQYKSEFLANMSHELRTPLNSLLILSKLLRENKKGNLTKEQVKSLGIINKSGKDLLELINEILDLSKIEAGKMKYEFSDVPVSDISSEIKQNFKPVAENKELELKVEQSDQFPDKIHTDKQRLMQIIKNLLSNAFKFTSSGGIKVFMGMPDKKTSFVREELSHENTCFISVEDSGVGIPKDKLNAIFEAFQQADGSISRKFGGTGLGLSISRQLSHLLGGEIHVDSTEGKGSVFTVYLPTDKKLAGKDIAEKEKEEVESEPEEKPAEKAEVKEKPVIKEKKKEEPKEEKPLPLFVEDDRDTNDNKLMVLIIHDDKNKTEKLIELSHKRNFSVVAAANIKYGMKLAEKYGPQAIILSAELSDSEELDELKRNSATKQLPVHVVSRVEDSVLENIEELKTPESDNFHEVSKNIERKLSKEYKQVLVVEDDEATRESIQLLFENKDIIIHEAKTAQEAYDLISTKPFDSVILDLGLPDYSGEELLKKLKDNGIEVPNVIIHTARELSTKELRSLQKYSDSIVIKGVKSDERLMDEVTLFLHQVENIVPKTYTVSPDEDEDNAGFKGKKVLVVDDDIRNVFALAQILEEREIEVLEAENGEMAIDVLKDNPDIDLVLMDIMMPIMNGYEAMEVIRQTPKLEDIPIITLTAKAMKEDYQKAIDSGANDYISKPVDVEKLMSLLKIWLFK